jgi:hypothetical protein
MMKITEHLKHKGMCSLFVICIGTHGLVMAADYKVSTTEIAYPTKKVAIKFMKRVYEDLGHHLTIQEYPQGRALLDSNAGYDDC